MLKQTHIYATLGVSASTYGEIAAKLQAAAYHHAFDNGVIDMQGIGLVQDPEAEGELDWAAAKAHFDEARQVYRDMEDQPGANTTLALAAVFAPLGRRYEAAERTPDLHKEMMDVE